jgi:tetratricopeptide (TPR) repeat protein
VNEFGSATIRIGPVAGPDLSFGPSVQPALRLRALLERKDKGALPCFLDEYLAGVGVELHLWGGERLPSRLLIWSILKDCSDLKLEGEQWARAAVRIGNVHALLVLGTIDLPLDDSWLTPFVREHAEKATALYAQGAQATALVTIAESNRALLMAQMGEAEKGLALLDSLLESKAGEEAQLQLKKAAVLMAVGQKEEANGILKVLDRKTLSRRQVDVLHRLEGLV